MFAFRSRQGLACDFEVAGNKRVRSAGPAQLVFKVELLGKSLVCGLTSSGCSLWSPLRSGPLFGLRGGGCGSPPFDQSGKPDRAIVRDLNPRGRPADAHGRDRSVNLHVAGLCNLPSDEGESAFDKIEKARIR